MLTKLRGDSKRMTNENEKEMPGTDSWGGFLKNFLKAQDVKDENEEYAVTEVSVTDRDGKYQLSLNLEKNAGKDKYIFDLNMTNMLFVKNKGFTPEQLVGKVLKFRKVLVTNPTTKTEVDGIRIREVK